jgi:glycerol-3-phosphate dehydrogenase (NAD(P)+)
MNPSQNSRQVGIIGAGAWGTTLAKVLADNGHVPVIWSHSEAIAQDINQSHKNTTLLPDIELPSSITSTTSLEESCKDKDLIVLVVASQFYQNTLEQIKPLLNHKTYLLSATKGINEKDNKRFSEILLETFPKEYHSKIGILSGPNISREIALEKVSTTVISSPFSETAKYIQGLFHNQYLRVYTNTDMVGTELGGTLKNIIAIAAGILDGLGMGDNAKSAVMVRGLVEMTRFATYFGAKPETLYGLTGMGDLITTCSSTLSRNHHVGSQLGRGQTLENILKDMTAVAEGVSTCKLVWDIAKKHKIDMPVTEQIHRILFENVSVPNAIHNLMTRDMKPEG